MKSNQMTRSIIVLVLFACSAISAFVPDTQAADFEKGSRRLSVTAGSGHSFDNSYFVMGLGAGYFVYDGLELGLDVEAWLGSDPDIYKLSPHVKYVLPLEGQLRPYAGGFYRHIFIDDFDDLDSIGVRGGVYFISAQNWFFGAGAVYESYLDCEDDTYSSCDDIYPEITFSLSF